MKRDLLILLILFTFWGMWLYTEFTEYDDRENFKKEVTRFMERGDRFTQQDASALEKEIQHVQEKVELLNEIVGLRGDNDG